MRKICLLGFALSLFTVCLFFACKKEDMNSIPTGTTTSTGSPSVNNNQMIFDGETIDFISAIGVPSSSLNKYTITGASISGAALTIILPDSIAPTADANYTLVPNAVGLVLSGKQATFNIANTPKHPTENWGPLLSGSLELKIVDGKIQIKFLNVSVVKVGTILPAVNASAQMTTAL